MKFLKFALYAGVAVALMACGGGNKSTNTSTTTTTPTASSVAIIDVLTSSNVLQSSSTEVVITAHVKNASNATMTGQTVVFSATSGNLEVVSAVSDASGVVTAKLTAGSNKSIRDITVTATVGSVSGNVSIAVTDTAVTVAGSGSLPQGGASTTYTVRAVDSAGAAISGATFTVASSLSNAIATSPLATNASGNATFTYTPTNAGTDTLTVSGLGLVTKTTVVISNVDLSVVTPTSNTAISVGANQTVTVQYKIAGAGILGKTVTFSTTRGTIPCNSTCDTDSDGKATATLTSTTAGPATVLAQIFGVGQVSLPVQFVAAAPSTVVVQANPGAVSPNSAGSTTNQSTIEAVVRDANLNAVANTQVAFSMVSDLSNGSLSSGVATTDANGRAQVQFIPGANSTANNGVVITAQAGTASGQATLTVSGQALFINIAFGNDMTALSSTLYSKTYSVYVTTATGGAVANQTLSLSALPIDYDKGSMTYSSSLWVAVPTNVVNSVVVGCPSEDRNENGILNAGEDTNSSGDLTPGNIASVSPVSVTTDAAGFASFNLTYGKQQALWSRVKITARTSVGGTESSRSIQLRLPILVADIGDATVPPAGVNSPFGIAADCASKD